READGVGPPEREAQQQRGLAVGELVEHAEEVAPGQEGGNDQHQQVGEDDQGGIDPAAEGVGEDGDHGVAAGEMRPGQETEDGKADPRLDQLEVAADGGEAGPDEGAADDADDGDDGDDQQHGAAGDGDQARQCVDDAAGQDRK